MKKFRFFIPALVHLPVHRKYMACAFTMKIYKMCEMLMSLGHEVILLGAEFSNAPCTEFIQTHTLKELRETWGEGDTRFELGYDWENKGFKHDFNTNRSNLTLKFYQKCIQEILERKQPDDFLLLMQGQYHKPIADAVGLYLTCEPGIGYRGSYTPFRAFESAYLQNFTYGSEHPKQSIDGKFYDRVIPNYFDTNDFDFTPASLKEDYYLFIGRLIHRKGIKIADLVTKHLGAKLKIAGQGALSWDPEKKKLITEEFTLEGDNIDFVGFADTNKRKELMSKAKAVFVPTLYLEAFGGVNVEAQLSGTPVITTNFGCFPETVEHGKTGFLCNTLQDFVSAAKRAPLLDSHYIHVRAIDKYSMENVKYEFQHWFEDLYQVYLSTTSSDIKGWHFIKESLC